MQQLIVVRSCVKTQLKKWKYCFQANTITSTRTGASERHRETVVALHLLQLQQLQQLQELQKLQQLQAEGRVSEECAAIVSIQPDDY